MPRQRSHTHGVPDWKLKLPLCRKLLGAMTNAELADKVFSRAKDQDMAVKAADNFRKWYSHTPTRSDGFFDAIGPMLGCREMVTGAMLIDANIDRFIGYLPAERQRRAREILSDSHLTNDRSLRNGEWHQPSQANGMDERDDPNVIVLEHQGPVETIAMGVRAGRIDQRHYYLDPDSADGWSDLVNAAAYPTYDHCKTALQGLLESDPWQQAIGSVEAVTVVMLAGGGAPTKDLMVLRSLLAQPVSAQQVYYYLLDISLYMLRYSALWIRKHSGTVDGFERAEIRYVHHDVLNMKSYRGRFHRHGKVVFCITGGTIGNVSEGAFFRSLNHAANEGDLLIISADTIDEIPSGDVEATMINKYNHGEFKNRFLRPVVRGVLSELNVHESISNALTRVKVSVRVGDEGNWSDVAESLTVIVTLDVNGREITLLTSTRYRSSHLTSFTSRFGWELLGEVPSPLNRSYKQFLFIRKRIDKKGMGHVP